MPVSRSASHEDLQLKYAREHESLIRVAPVWQHYALGPVLGRGAYALVRQGRRRAASHPTIPLRVAVKVIDKAATADLKEKARKAVNISMQVAEDVRLHNHIEKRGPHRRTFYEGEHKNVESGDELYKKGQDLFRDMRKAARDAAKGAGPSS